MARNVMHLLTKDGKVYQTCVKEQVTPEATMELAIVQVGTQCLGMEEVNDSGNVDPDGVYKLEGSGDLRPGMAVELLPMNGDEE